MYMVQFTSGEGRPSHHVSDSLDEAVKFIERLHNSEGVNDARLFEMTELPLEVKAYYQVAIRPYVHATPSSNVSTLDVTSEVLEPAPAAADQE